MSASESKDVSREQTQEPESGRTFPTVPPELMESPDDTLQVKAEKMLKRLDLLTASENKNINK